MDRDPQLKSTISHGRMAFTLVELLVVIAIIGVLVSLLLPAIQSAREAARRIMCVQQLRQVALGVTEFESAYGACPPGRYLARSQPTKGASCNACREPPLSTLAVVY